MVGAGGAVGRELLLLLEEWGQPAAAIERLGRGSKPRAAEDSLVFLCTPPEISARWSAALAAQERPPRVVVDLSSAARRRAPLIVPEANGAELLKLAGPGAGRPLLLAGPNCTAALAAVVLAPLERAVGLAAVSLVSLQAASGAGAAGLAALAAEEEEGPSRGTGEGPFPAVLHRNVIPAVGDCRPREASGEEEKVLWELRHLLGRGELPLEVSTTRVPVERCHSLALHLTLERGISPAAARECLLAAPGVRVDDDPHGPRPRECAGTDLVHVGRIRRGSSGPRSLSLFAVGDQLRKGAALNALQVAALLSASDPC